MNHVARMFPVCASAFGVTSFVCSCLAAPPEQPTSSSDVSARAFDARGAEVPLDRLPRRPQFVVSSAGVFAPGAALLLFRGALDASVLADLSALPLRAASAARLVESEARAGPRSLRLAPLRALPAGEPYTLALPSSALGSEVPPYTAGLHTAAESSAGAAWLGTLPPAGASGVPPNLGPLLLALDGDVEGVDEGVWLEGPDGLAVPSRLARGSCAEFETRAATCIRLELPGALHAGTQYRLRSGRALRDAHGAPIETLDAAFTTAGSDDERPPTFEAISCLRDERPVAVGCALLGDHAVGIRLRTGESVRALLRSGERRAARLLPDGSGSLELDGLESDAAFELEIEVIDAAGNLTAAREALRTSPPLAPVTVAEVLADPSGPEPAQEYVELVNFGQAAISLHGFSLVDGADDRPNTVASEVELAPGARALLVADTFDASSARDLTPPPGTQLLRLGAALTRSGLANAGEPLLLRDAGGRRLAGIPVLPPAGRGQCVLRAEEAAPRGDRADDFYTGDCSPGR